MELQHSGEPERLHPLDGIRDFFDFGRLSPKDQKLFNADLKNCLQDINAVGDTLTQDEFDGAITMLTNWEWYRRGQDTLTQNGAGGQVGTSAEEGRLLDAKAAAKFLGISESQFTKLAAKGHIPFLCVAGEVHNNGRGQHKKYRREDLDEWAAENVVGGNRR